MLSKVIIVVWCQKTLPKRGKYECLRSSLDLDGFFIDRYSEAKRFLCTIFNSISNGVSNVEGDRWKAERPVSFGLKEEGNSARFFLSTN